jgi:hypothetical protein
LLKLLTPVYRNGEVEVAAIYVNGDEQQNRLAEAVASFLFLSDRRTPMAMNTARKINLQAQALQLK